MLRGKRQASATKTGHCTTLSDLRQQLWVSSHLWLMRLAHIALLKTQVTSCVAYDVCIHLMQVAVASRVMTCMTSLTMTWRMMWSVVPS